MKRVIVYVDVGGSLTRLIVKDETHREIKNISFVASPATLKTQIQTALHPYAQPLHLVLGIRGVWTEPERQEWRKKFKGMGRSVHVMSDVELAHALIFKKEAGILLNAGTGSIAYGCAPDRKIARAGGLGPLLGDEGSGFWLGREYLKEIYQRRHDLDTIRKFAKHATPISEIASLAKKIIEQTFEKRDRSSKKLVDQAQRHLRSLAEDVAGQLKWKGRVPLKLVGGLFHNPDFKKSFIRKLPRNRFQIL